MSADAIIVRVVSTVAFTCLFLCGALGLADIVNLFVKWLAQ